MNRRLVIRAGAALSLSALSTVARAIAALAGKGWCRGDPVGEFNGQSVRWIGTIATSIDRVRWFRFVVGVKPGDTFVPHAADRFVVVEGEAPRSFVRFEFQTDDGTAAGTFEVVPLEAGPIGPSAVEFSGTSFTWYW